MARPKKIGWFYYPKNTDFLRHEDISYLRDEKKAEAVLLLEALWSRMYEAGGPIELTLPLRLALSKESTVKREDIDGIISLSVELGLLFWEVDALFSMPVKRRIDFSLAENERKAQNKRNKNAAQTNELESSSELTQEESDTNTARERENGGSLSLSFLNNKEKDRPPFTLTAETQANADRVYGSKARKFYVAHCRDIILTSGRVPLDFDAFFLKILRSDKASKSNFYHPNNSQNSRSNLPERKIINE